MFKTCFLLLLFAFSFTRVLPQCIVALPAPACTGVEPSLADNETLAPGITKWYYGPPVTMNSLILDGGTLVVCGDLTIDKFYINSGTIFIRPGARFVIGSGIGAGLIFTGNASIYNYGICEIQRNLSLDAGATAAGPNLVVNATASSIFKMSNQYLVINNRHSWFVNNGKADFWGIITDPNASPGSVCLGDQSSTRMAVLINKVADTYMVPTGTACVNVFQFSQFSNKLTESSDLFVCVGASHTSVSGCGGCPANNWGDAQVFTACSNCEALTVLSTDVNPFIAVATRDGYNMLQWQVSTPLPGSIFRIMRSTNNRDFQMIDSMVLDDDGAVSFTTMDPYPKPGNNYYMINITEPGGLSFNSKTVKVFSEINDGFTVYPTPFKNDFTIHYTSKIQQIILTDLAGRNIPIKFFPVETGTKGKIVVPGNIQPGIYIIHIRTEKNVMAKTVFKE